MNTPHFVTVFLVFLSVALYPRQHTGACCIFFKLKSPSKATQALLWLSGHQASRLTKDTGAVRHAAAGEAVHWPCQSAAGAIRVLTAVYKALHGWSSGYLSFST